jgi:hypothetical protein
MSRPLFALRAGVGPWGLLLCLAVLAASAAAAQNSGAAFETAKRPRVGLALAVPNEWYQRIDIDPRLIAPQEHIIL